MLQILNNEILINFVTILIYILIWQVHEKIIIFSVFPIISFNFLRFRKTTMQNRGIWLTFKCLEMDKHLKIILDMYMHIDFLNNCIETKLIKKKSHPLPWRRKWQPAPVFLLGESHEQRNLASYSPRGRKSWTHLATTPPPPPLNEYLLQDNKNGQ